MCFGFHMTDCQTKPKMQMRVETTVREEVISHLCRECQGAGLGVCKCKGTTKNGFMRYRHLEYRARHTFQLISYRPALGFYTHIPCIVYLSGLSLELVLKF